MHLIDTLTENERKGVEAHFGTPWEELSEMGKLMRGLMYRHCLSPEALTTQITGSCTSNNINDISDPTKQDVVRSMLMSIRELSGDINNAIQHQGDGEG